MTGLSSESKPSINGGTFGCVLPFGIAITKGMWWVAVIMTGINVLLVIVIISSFIFYKLGKQTKKELYESIVLIAPIVIFEILIIILPFMIKI